jgi:hypothetical protein
LVSLGETMGPYFRTGALRSRFDPDAHHDQTLGVVVHAGGPGEAGQVRTEGGSGLIGRDDLGRTPVRAALHEHLNRRSAAQVSPPALAFGHADIDEQRSAAARVHHRDRAAPAGSPPRAREQHHRSGQQSMCG